MQTEITEALLNTTQGKEADAILRSCVHCGFCLATCPTYQLVGDELDSPRGRIYLIKQVLEGETPTQKTQSHLDRCLTCRACESTCPSGVQYGRLVDIGRELVEERVSRSLPDRLLRSSLRYVLPRSGLFNSLLALGRVARPALPQVLKDKIPLKGNAGSWPTTTHTRKMLLLDGCVQPGMAPNINSATARVMDKLGVTLVRADKVGCCGAISHHLNAQEEALGYVKRNIDAWWPHIEAGAEAIVVTASGCGTMLQEYGHLLQHDSAYASKAVRVSERFRDVSQVVSAEQNRLTDLLKKSTKKNGEKIAFHAPCSLQHGLKLKNIVEPLLSAAGFTLTSVPDAHLCCGSAGTYSILQPELSKQLLKNKVAALESGAPDLIATANIGCLTHIESGSSTNVKHWIEILDERLA
ncbi:MAG: glycolate oxidase subunit GlcF [Burkholderiales bacterium]